MKKFTIQSPAKINFGLYVVNKREDGYHDIETIFYPVSLHDELSFELSSFYSLITNDHALAADPASNLVTKAVRLLESESGMRIPVTITLHKRIPMGAGLGGGSSNAASALLALNEMFMLGLSRERLSAIALQLGSDVPFFISPYTSFATSRGEVLQRVELQVRKPLLLINPGIHVPTVWAYSRLTPRPAPFNLLTLHNQMPENLRELRGKVTNDFEEIVCARHPVMREIIAAMYSAGAELVQMSGSGSTLFAFYPDVQRAEHAAGLFADKYFTYLEREPYEYTFS